MRNCILFIRIVNASLNNHLVLKKRCDFYDKFGNLKNGRARASKVSNLKLTVSLFSGSKVPTELRAKVMCICSSFFKYLSWISYLFFNPK